MKTSIPIITNRSVILFIYCVICNGKMIARKFLFVILAELTLQGVFSQNEKQNVTLETTKPKSLVVSTEASVLNNSSTFGGLNTTQPIYRANETLAQNSSLGEPPPDGNNVQVLNTTTPHLNGSSVLVETLNETRNFSTVSAASASPEAGPAFRLQKSAAIAAGVFLVSAVIGYLSCVGYRRYLQRKYGESQMLAKEDVYDTSDLRYYAI